VWALVDLLASHLQRSDVQAAKEKFNLSFDLPVAAYLSGGVHSFDPLDRARPDFAEKAEVTPLTLEKMQIATGYVSALEEKHELDRHLYAAAESKTFHVVLSFCPFGAVELNKALDSLLNVIDCSHLYHGLKKLSI
jgi:hypothetical protein